MKINKKIFAGMAVLTLLFGSVLAGCSTTKYTKVETETSKAIYEAASELVGSQPGGIRAGALVEGLADKFPGLKKAPLLAFQGVLITVVYQDVTYSINCTIEDWEGKAVEGTGGAVMVNTEPPENTIVTGITSVYTYVAVEPDQKQ